MTVAEPRFWMQGKSASTLIDLSDDPSSLDDGGFWAVSVTYEGAWRCAKFADVYDEPFSTSDIWRSTSHQWSSSMTQEEYVGYVTAIRQAIEAGDVYQANACRIFSRRNDHDLEALFAKILVENPAPYAHYFKIPGLEIASASPELFIEVTEMEGVREVRSSPIKGTSKSSFFPEKDQAENIMIVDLVRNDMGEVCEIGSVQVPRLLGVEEHPGLFHLVSDVVGRLRSDISWSDISRALLPAGSISGAPKSTAVKIIKENEGTRGSYCGVSGWVHGGEAKLAVGIRTFWQSGEYLSFGTGAGITWGSDALEEWDETVLKAARLLAIAGGEFSA